MGKYFTLAQTEPIIADCIRKIYRRKKDWVYHEQMVQCLLNDPIGKHLVEKAFRRWKSELHKSQWVEWRNTTKNWASNMVQHFSQTGYFHYDREFERKKDGNDAWAYKPKQNA